MTTESINAVRMDWMTYFSDHDICITKDLVMAQKTCLFAVPKTWTNREDGALSNVVSLLMVTDPWSMVYLHIATIWTIDIIAASNPVYMEENLKKKRPYINKT